MADTINTTAMNTTPDLWWQWKQWVLQKAVRTFWKKFYAPDFLYFEVYPAIRKSIIIFMAWIAGDDYGYDYDELSFAGNALDSGRILVSQTIIMTIHSRKKYHRFTSVILELLFLLRFRYKKIIIIKKKKTRRLSKWSRNFVTNKYFCEPPIRPKYSHT